MIGTITQTRDQVGRHYYKAERLPLSFSWQVNALIYPVVKTWDRERLHLLYGIAVSGNGRESKWRSEKRVAGTIFTVPTRSTKSAAILNCDLSATKFLFLPRTPRFLSFSGARPQCN